jgi:hypothetical protein
VSKIILCNILKKRTVYRGLIVAFVVGTIVLLINQGPAIYHGIYPAPWQIILTYMVPYLVSTISSALADAHNARNTD